MRATSHDPERTARLGAASRPPAAPTPRALAIGWLASTLLGTFAPRLFRRLEGARTPRGRAVSMGLHFTGMQLADWMVRAFARQTIERRELEARLRTELGRPPWPGELHAAWLAEHGLDENYDTLR
jgi:hypothetical protein